MFIFLLISYLITVPLKKKMTKSPWLILRKFSQKLHVLSLFLQDNGTAFKNEQVMSVFDSLGIKNIYSNPY